jgi:hypothetical protein
MLLGDYIEYFYKTYRRMRHQETTQAVQLNYIFTHVKPSPLGKMDIADVKNIPALV